MIDWLKNNAVGLIGIVIALCIVLYPKYKIRQEEKEAEREAFFRDVDSAPRELRQLHAIAQLLFSLFILLKAVITGTAFIVIGIFVNNWLSYLYLGFGLYFLINARRRDFIVEANYIADFRFFLRQHSSESNLSSPPEEKVKDVEEGENQ